MPTPLIPGAIYQTAFIDVPCRVIAFDEVEVHYDAYWPTLDQWTFTGHPRTKCVYYRIRPVHFLKDATLLREQPFTPEERQLFRPDLPLRCCRHRHLVWTEEVFPDAHSYVAVSATADSGTIVLPAATIALQPFGPKGGTKKSVVVHTAADAGFTESELLWLAHNIQAPQLREVQPPGVGLYRSGHEKGVPSYYIGGYRDTAGFLAAS